MKRNPDSTWHFARDLPRSQLDPSMSSRPWGCPYSNCFNGCWNQWPWGISIDTRALRQNAGSTKIWIRRSSAICVTGVFKPTVDGVAGQWTWSGQLFEKRGPFFGKHPLKTIFGLHICGLQRSSRYILSWALGLNLRAGRSTDGPA